MPLSSVSSKALRVSISRRNVSDEPDRRVAELPAGGGSWLERARFPFELANAVEQSLRHVYSWRDTIARNR